MHFYSAFSPGRLLYLLLIFFFLVLAFFVGSVLYTLQYQPPAREYGQDWSRLVVENVRLASSGEYRHLLAENDRIRAISAEAISKVPGELRIDARGAWLSPGLVDMHVHVFDRADLLLLLAHGVTSARHMSGEYKTLRLRQEVEQGLSPGPRLTVASPILTMKSEHYAKYAFNRALNSPEHGARLVKKYANSGYDLIKVYDGLDKITYTAIAETAQERGLPVAGHPSFHFEFEEFAQPNLQSIEHVEMLFQAPMHYQESEDAFNKLIQQFERFDSPYVCSTLIVFEDLARIAEDSEQFFSTYPAYYKSPYLMYFVQEIIDNTAASGQPQWWRSKSDYLVQLAGRLHRAGVPLVLGSDAGYVTVPGHSAIEEMLLLREAGIPANEVLNIASLQGHKALKQEEEYGSIAPGKRADFVLSTHKPADNLETFYELQSVVTQGYFYDENALGRMKDGAKRHMPFYEALGWYVMNLFEQFFASW